MAWPYMNTSGKTFDLRQRRLLVAEVLRTLPKEALPKAEPVSTSLAAVEAAGDASGAQKEIFGAAAVPAETSDVMDKDEPEAEASPESPGGDSSGIGGPFQGRVPPPPLLSSSIVDPRRQGSTPARLVWLSSEVLQSMCGNAQELVDGLSGAKADALLAVDGNNLSIRSRGLGQRLGSLARRYISPSPQLGSGFMQDLEVPGEEPDYFEEFGGSKQADIKPTIVETLCSLQLGLTEVERRLKATAQALGTHDPSTGPGRSRATWLANQSGARKQQGRESVAIRYAPALQKLRAVQAISSSQVDLGQANGRRFAFASRH